MGKSVVRVRGYRFLEQITRSKSVEEMQFGNPRGIEPLRLRTNWNGGQNPCALFWGYAVHTALLSQHRVSVLHQLLQVGFRPRLGPRCCRFTLHGILKS